MIAALIANAIARITCRVRGHKRGKRVDAKTVTCPRCGRPKKREERKAKS